ncbi:MAG: carbon storage regulator [Gemmataceae bacterium]
MLVLSRRLDEKIVLPTVPAVIKVISAQSGLVRLGIEAPTSVPILREELAQAGKTPTTAGAAADPTSPETISLRHEIRNRLNNLTLGVTLLRLNLSEADPEVRRTLEGLQEEIQALRQRMAREYSQTGTGQDGRTLVPS